MGNFIGIILGTTGEFLGDVPVVNLDSWLKENSFEAGYRTQTWITVWPCFGD